MSQDQPKQKGVLGTALASTSTDRDTGDNNRTEIPTMQQQQGDKTDNASRNPRKRQRPPSQEAGKTKAVTLPVASPALTVPLFEDHMQFPEQLWELLKYTELNDAIWWMPSNDAFAINIPMFSAKLLDLHFKGNKFSSIIRKLNRWGFRKYIDRSLPPKTVAYYHRSFQKGRPELIKMIEKEEGKPPQVPSGSQFFPFPEATTSQRITHLLQPMAEPAAMEAAQPTRGAIFSPGVAYDSLAQLTAGTPISQRHESSILQSIFGQRGAVLAGSSSTTNPNPAAATRIAALTAAAPANTLLPSTATSRSSEWLRRSNLHLSLPVHDNMDERALLATMVSNIERERQNQRHQEEGRIFWALQREQSRIVSQEQKQEPLSRPATPRPSVADEASLFALMATGHSRSFSEIQGGHLRLHLQQQQQRFSLQQQDHQNRLLLSAAQWRGEDGISVAGFAQRQQQQREQLLPQLQLQRQLQSAIASPNPFASPLQQQPRRVLGWDALALPEDLLLSPQQQRVRQQVLQLQHQGQHRRDEELEREEQNRE